MLLQARSGQRSDCLCEAEAWRERGNEKGKGAGEVIYYAVLYFDGDGSETMLPVGDFAWFLTPPVPSPIPFQQTSTRHSTGKISETLIQQKTMKIEKVVPVTKLVPDNNPYIHC